MYGAGAKVGFFQGDIRLLPDDMKTLQPTVFPVVPRLLNRVYDKVSDLCRTQQPPLSSHSALNINPTLQVSCFKRCNQKSCH